MALLEIPVSGCTCLSTTSHESQLKIEMRRTNKKRTLVDVRRVSLLSGFLPLLLVTLSGGRRLAKSNRSQKPKSNRSSFEVQLTFLEVFFAPSVVDLAGALPAVEAGFLSPVVVAVDLGGIFDD